MYLLQFPNRLISSLFLKKPGIYPSSREIISLVFFLYLIYVELRREVYFTANHNYNHPSSEPPPPPSTTVAPTAPPSISTLPTSLLAVAPCLDAYESPTLPWQVLQKKRGVVKRPRDPRNRHNSHPNTGGRGGPPSDPSPLQAGGGNVSRSGLLVGGGVCRSGSLTAASASAAEPPDFCAASQGGGGLALLLI